MLTRIWRCSRGENPFSLQWIHWLDSVQRGNISEGNMFLYLTRNAWDFYPCRVACEYIREEWKTQHNFQCFTLRFVVGCYEKISGYNSGDWIVRSSHVLLRTGRGIDRIIKNRNTWVRPRGPSAGTFEVVRLGNGWRNIPSTRSTLVLANKADARENTSTSSSNWLPTQPTRIVLVDDSGAFGIPAHSFFCPD